MAVVVLATLGYGIKRAIQSTMESTLRSELQTLLTVERSMLEKWLQVQESGALARPTAGRCGTASGNCSRSGPMRRCTPTTPRRRTAAATAPSSWPG